MLFLLVSHGCALLRPLPEIIKGVWDIKQISITAEGVPNPDVVHLSIVFISPTNDLFTGILIGGTHRLFLNITLGRNDSVSLSVGPGLEIEAQIVTSPSDTRHIHRAVDHFVFSLVIQSSWRAELTLVDRLLNTVTLYRCIKEHHVSIFSRILSFLQTVIFRII
jgi:hypothetical protein